MRTRNHRIVLTLASAYLVMALCTAAAPSAEPPRKTIQNDLVRVTIDSQGRLVELTNLRTKWNYAGNCGLWRVFYSENDVRDVEATALGVFQKQ